MSANLDLLRASAVLLVLIAHILEASGLKSNRVILLGHTGVMIFFVHTAFVLMLSLDRLHADSPAHVARRFYLRRAFRIYPLPILVLGALLLISRFVPAAYSIYAVSYHPTLRQALANFLLVQNLFVIPSILVTMWSLPPEVQMYAVLPVFHRLKRFGIADLLMLWSVMLIAASLLPPRLADIVQYVPCFIPGIIAYKMQSSRRPVFGPAGFVLVTAIIAASYVSLGIMHKVLASLFCLLLGLSIAWFRGSQLPALNSAAKAVATRSYSVYLLHSPLLLLCFTLIASPPVRIATFLLSLALLCELTYQFVERPALDLGTRLAHRWATPALPLQASPEIAFPEPSKSSVAGSAS